MYAHFSWWNRKCCSFYPTNQLGPFVKRTKYVVVPLPHHPSRTMNALGHLS